MLASRLTLLSLLKSYRAASAVYAACKFRIPDRLLSGALSDAQLAESAGVHCESLYRILRALSVLQVVAENEPRMFSLTPLGRVLVSSAPDSLYPAAMMSGDEFYRAFSCLADAVATGTPAFDIAYGEPLFDYLERHPHRAELFNLTMQNTNDAGELVANVYDLRNARLLIDVGGGLGQLLVPLLRAHPETHGVVFDLPSAIAQATRVDVSGDVRGRLEYSVGDFFESVPAGGDVYLLSQVLHDWSDESARRILLNIRRAMVGSARLLMIERVLPMDGTPSPGKITDLTMLATTQGRERTEAEIRALAAAAGLGVTMIRVLTDVDVCLVECRASG